MNQSSLQTQATAASDRSARAAKNGRSPDRRQRITLAAARRYCRRLARSHYENFSVVSCLLPRPLHQHFYNVYAYCRWADDLGDEVTNAAGRYDAASRTRSLELLSWWRAQLLRCYGDTGDQPASQTGASPKVDARGAVILAQAGLAPSALHPVMVALSDTIERFSIPAEPFLDLIAAFEQDQRVAEYETYDQLLGYCRNSANPVGRLVLYLCRAYTEESARLADCVCTGLQLTNFWQDVARDFDRGRIYLPRRDRERLGYRDAELHGRVYNDAFRDLMRLEVDRARGWLERGLPLAAQVPRSVQVDIELFVRGGLTILDKIEAQDYHVWRRRPVLTKWDQLQLFSRCTVSRAGRTRSPRRRNGRLNPSDVPAHVRSRTGPAAATTAPANALDNSYAYCASLARRTAKNFYFSFLALPPAKRRAMCALYAFLRTTDDIGDGPGSAHKRRERLDAWRSSLGRALEGRYEHPILPAMCHTLRRYRVAPDYLYAVIEGVAMDLGRVRFRTFEELSRYCYRVASVVGLACICIWGYRGELAPHYAHQCGLAFQLTNILRDLKEDVQRDRIYLPLEDFERFGYSTDDLTALRYNEPFRSMMQFQVQRARRFYQRAAHLIDHLSPAGRPVFRTMFGIYSGILDEIPRAGYDVFGRRAALKPWRKMWILARSFFPSQPPTEQHDQSNAELLPDAFAASEIHRL